MLPSPRHHARWIFGLTAVAALVSGCTTTTAQGKVLSLIDARVPQNCSVDVTTQIQQYLDSVPNNSTVIFQHGACYRIDGTIHVEHRRGLVIEGNQATFKAVTSGRELGSGARGRAQWDFERDDSITVANMTVLGANPDVTYVAALEAQHNFNLAGVTNMLIENVSGGRTYGDFVYVGPQYAGQVIGSDHVTVRNSHFDRAGRQGMSITQGTNIVFDSNSLGNTARSIFDLEPNSASGNIEHVTIENNSIGHSRLNFLANWGAASKIDDINILNNQLNDHVLSVDVNAPVGARRSNYVISGNTSSGAAGNPAGAALIFRHVDNIVVSGNTTVTENYRHMGLVALRDTTNVRVTDNATLTATRVVVDEAPDNVNVCQARNRVGNPLMAYRSDAGC